MVSITVKETAAGDCCGEHLVKEAGDGCNNYRLPIRAALATFSSNNSKQQESTSLCQH